MFCVIPAANGEVIPPDGEDEALNRDEPPGAMAPPGLRMEVGLNSEDGVVVPEPTPRGGVVAVVRDGEEESGRGRGSPLERNEPSTVPTLPSTTTTPGAVMVGSAEAVVVVSTAVPFAVAAAAAAFSAGLSKYLLLSRSSR